MRMQGEMYINVQYIYTNQLTLLRYHRRHKQLRNPNIFAVSSQPLDPQHLLSPPSP